MLPKDGIVDFAYRAVRVGGTTTLLQDLVLLLLLNLNIFLWLLLFNTFNANFSAILSLLSSKVEQLRANKF